MRAGLRVLGAAPGVLLVAASLAAQTLPVPTLPPEPTPEAEPTPPPGTPQKGPPTAAPPAAEPALARPRPWEYSLGMGVGWDSNTSFQVTQGQADVALVPRAAVARTFWSPRGQLRAEATGRWVGYAEQREQRRGYGDFNLDGRYRSSPRTAWQASAAYALGYTDSSEPLRDQGVLLPLVETRTLTGTLGVSRQMGPRTSLRIDGRFYRVDFDAPGLVTGESVRGTMAVDYQLGSRSTAAIVYALEDTLADQLGRTYLTNFGSLQLTRLLTPRSAVLLEGGASYTPDAARAGLPEKQSFFGGASLSRQVKRSSVTVFLRREVAPAFGTGLSRLESRAGLTAIVPIGQNWRLRMAGTHVRPDTPPGAVTVYASADDSLLSLSRRLRGRLEVSGEASYRRRGPTTALSAVETLQIGLFVTLLDPSGRMSERPVSR